MKAHYKCINYDQIIEIFYRVHKAAGDPDLELTADELIARIDNRFNETCEWKMLPKGWVNASCGWTLTIISQDAVYCSQCGRKIKRANDPQ